MGSTLSCVSSSSVQVQQPATRPAAPARVIAADGSLKELPGDAASLPSVSDVLGSGGAADAASPSFFVCNSDALYFNEPPPALAADERLRHGQMYFVLPAEMLGRRLSSADMAALAARAISALPDETPQQRRRPGRVASKKKMKKQVRVVPVLLQDDGEDESVFHETLNELTLGEFTVLTSLARSGAGDKVAEEPPAAGRRKTRSAALKRALSMIREDAE